MKGERLLLPTGEGSPGISMGSDEGSGIFRFAKGPEERGKRNEGRGSTDSGERFATGHVFMDSECLRVAPPALDAGDRR